MGLAISKAIVEAHSGEIAVTRTGPEGTIVAVTLPMRGA
ncbi:MAG: HAMP domain-containing histidine kinase [Actinobacteria bacterium]|nr:HAMP domain-containing histidine kinase [Actinomycetota bacterium]